MSVSSAARLHDSLISYGWPTHFGGRRRPDARPRQSDADRDTFGPPDRFHRAEPGLEINKWNVRHFVKC